jgi:hypothetical protein
MFVHTWDIIQVTEGLGCDENEKMTVGMTNQDGLVLQNSVCCID